MAAEVVSCPQCEKKLRVPETLIGQLVKCPTCGANFTAEVAAPAKKEEPEEKKTTPSIRKKKDDDEEVPERLSGRKKKDDDDDDRPSRRSRRSSRDDDDDDDDDRPSRRSSRRSRRDDDDDDFGGRRRYLTPDRGATILTLGIIGLVTTLLGFLGVGLIFGIIAWIMGNTDLAEMRGGRMDRAGEGSTQGGRICGMIAVVLHIISLVCCVGYFLVVALAVGAGGR